MQDEFERFGQLVCDWDMLLIRNDRQFTKSRPGQSNDNGLVETGNGSVVRRTPGYASIHLILDMNGTEPIFSPLVSLYYMCSIGM